MIGLKIMLTGALVTAAAWAIAALNRDVIRYKPMWLVVPVVIGFFGGLAAVFLGALLALWGGS